MLKDPDELDRLARNEERMGRAVAREEAIPRSPVETAEPRGDAGVQAQMAPQETESRNPVVQAEDDEIGETDEIPLGVVRDDPMDDDDGYMRNDLPEPLQEATDGLTPLQQESGDEGGQAVPCELDSDSDGETDAGGAEPPAKRPREIYAIVPGSPGAWPCSDGEVHTRETSVNVGPCLSSRAHGCAPLPECRSAAPREELQQLLASSEVKRILGELDKLADLKMLAGRSKQAPLAASQYASECAEVYSPPRITAVAGRMGLKPAWALDLTTVDDEGKPWDFSRADQRKKAMKKLKDDTPLMLVACPMCGPFSTISELNYANMTEKEIREKLHGAMLHMKFALTLCLQQYLAGRLFMFEHPAGASSWSTKMMADMLSRK